MSEISNTIASKGFSVSFNKIYIYINQQLLFLCECIYSKTISLS